MPRHWKLGLLIKVKAFKTRHEDTFVSSPYIICVLLNGIIPGDVQGDATVTEIVNMAGRPQRSRILQWNLQDKVDLNPF